MASRRWNELKGGAFTGVMGASLVISALLAGGCESTPNGHRSAREIGLAEFSRPVDRHKEAQRDEADGEEEAVAGVERSGEPTPGADDGSDSPALPQLGAGIADTDDAWFGPPPGTRVIVDSLVGTVNGRPIYADTFFLPIEDQLRAISRRATQRAFLEQAGEVITQHLWQIVQNELFLADARAQLTEQQRQGIFAFMRALREQEILEGGGTQTSAERRLQEQHGMTMEEYLAARRDVALLHELRDKRIMPRVIVAWRDIEREYQRRFHEFNPPARMKVSRMRLSTARDAEMIEKVTGMLSEGAAFAEVAELAGEANGGAWQQFEIGAEGVDGLQLSETIKQHLRDLRVGETSEPFEVGASTWWLHVTEIDQPRGRSLYDPDVQRMLHEHIRQRRFNEEMNRYMESLLAEGVKDEVAKIQQRLLIIAYERYRPS